MVVELASYVRHVAERAASAKRSLRNLATAKKNGALENIAAQLEAHQKEILAENALDLAESKKNNLSSALLDRLQIDTKTIASMVDGIAEIIRLPDLAGEISEVRHRPSGIQVGKMRVPLGVIAIIYESRPNVTVDAAALCLKSGNAVILRGGSEAIRSNQAIARCITEGLTISGLPPTAVQLVETTDRAVVSLLLGEADYVDLAIPRGGKELVELVNRVARMPVLKHLHGVCHVFVDSVMDMDKALAIALNAKTQRYGTCNTMETLLVAEAVAEPFLKKVAPLYLDKGVELRGCEKTMRILPEITLAVEDDFYTEYLAPVLSIRVVVDLEAAIAHIEKYGSHHTDAIVTENYSHARKFLREVDSSSVMVNASTRFADGYEYGLGAEIGISTDKFHARGPVGLEGLTTQKYVVFGDGQIRT